MFVIVIVGVVGAVALISVASARVAARWLRTAILIVAVAFVAWTPFIFIAGSYDCSGDCAGSQVVVPWIWFGLGVVGLVLSVAVLVAATAKAMFRALR